MSNANEVLYQVKNNVITITINRPAKRNALNSSVLVGLNECFDRAAHETEAGVIVLTGAGNKAFCAGGDLEQGLLGDKTFLEMHNEKSAVPELFIKMHRCPKPIIAAVKGHCLAGGVGLCLSCDIVIASEDAVFGQPEINIGVWPYMVTAVLIRNLGRKKAVELCLTGELISATAAEKIGMINKVVPGDKLEEEVENMARKLNASSPAVMGLGKRSFYQIADMDFGDALEYLKAQLTINSQLEDLKEGVAAFREKRQPKWKGR
jgi:enoyl-CoA hydratase